MNSVPVPNPTTAPDPRTPFVSPIAALLKSRKAMIALLTALINLAIPFAPGLEAHRADLLTIGLILTSVIGTALIGGQAYEDGKGKGAPTTINTGSGSVAVTTPAPQSTSSPENGGARFPPTPPGHPG